MSEERKIPPTESDKYKIAEEAIGQYLPPQPETMRVEHVHYGGLTWEIKQNFKLFLGIVFALALIVILTYQGFFEKLTIWWENLPFYYKLAIRNSVGISVALIIFMAWREWREYQPPIAAILIGVISATHRTVQLFIGGATHRAFAMKIMPVLMFSRQPIRYMTTQGKPVIFFSELRLGFERGKLVIEDFKPFPVNYVDGFELLVSKNVVDKIAKRLYEAEIRLIGEKLIRKRIAGMMAAELAKIVVEAPNLSPKEIEERIQQFIKRYEVGSPVTEEVEEVRKMEQVMLRSREMRTMLRRMRMMPFEKFEEFEEEGTE